jgi:periplasmic divalent cation tolerance protein
MATVIGFVTFKSTREARSVVKKLLEKKLIACANLLPKVESHYRWKNRVKKGTEVLAVIKTKKMLERKVAEQIGKTHSYEMPVVEFFEAETAKEVQRWVERETK